MKPIFLDDFSVRATMDGRKTLVRIPVEPQPAYNKKRGFTWKGRTFGSSTPPTIEGALEKLLQGAPYMPGDMLYVAESWAGTPVLSGISDGGLIYKADYSEKELREMKRKHFRWQPGMKMPAKMARLILQVKNVQVEQLHESFSLAPGAEEQIRMEGLDPRDSYIAHWDNQLNESKLPYLGWDANPLVWLVEYEVISST